MPAMIRMPMSDGAEIAVYHAEPTGHRRGGLVLVQEIFGVTDHIRSLCDGYAADGFEVLSPAVFDREHPGFEAEYSGDGFARGVELASKLHPFDLTLADVQTCIDTLADKGPVFVVGYCYGGSVAWKAATQLRNVAAVSGYYGSMIPDAADEEPKVPTILHFGKKDDHIPLAGVEKVIAKDWPNATVYLYDARHGFNSDRRDDYDAESAKLARQRTLDLFAANGG
jgi:carboxymethylenebutenolidase